MRKFAILAIGLLATPLAAQDKTPTPVTLRLHPAAAPLPALKYSLLPTARDMQSGNAAVYYHRAQSPDWLRGLDRDAGLAKMHEWLETPSGQWPVKDVRTLLVHKSVFKELDLAARCENCDWQLTARIRDEGVALLLPELQGFRQLSQLLAIKARLEVLEGQTDAALRTMQTGFAMSRHLSEGPILFNALVGMATAQTMLGSVEEFVQRPGAPNLYWALRDLPEPFIDLRRPLQGDRLAVDAWWPALREELGRPKFQALPLQTLRANVDKVYADLGLSDRSGMAVMVGLAHPHAVAYFRALGHSQEELDVLPVTQVVLMHSLAQWDRWYDAIYRWHNVPYWQARTGLKKATAERDKLLRSERVPMIFLQHMLPTHENVFFQRARLQRRIAALLCVEAVRMHAAAHDGALPETLDEIRAVPIPLDPVTGKSFEYTNESGVGRLFGPPPAGESATERNGLLLQFTIVPKQ